ncbi:MAG: energy transducer TonB, partial [Ginsengibacter sp.]
MEANQILKADLLDIIFEGKNKEYGAYDLRKTYNRRITIALVTTVVIIALIFIVSVIMDNLSAKDNAVEMVVKDLTLEKIQPNEPPPPPPPPPPKLPPPPPIATIAFTPPKVVKD